MDNFSDHQLFSTIGFLVRFLTIIRGFLLLSLFLFNKFYRKRTVISAGEESTAAPVDNSVPAHTSSSSTTNELGRPYEVFLSFRGVDTRTNFTDHLYTALVDSGINTFRDDNEIRMGQELNSELLRAIQQSKISIPVFSRNYADSKWCLTELTKIVECREKMGQIVFPIFYDVEPSDVRNQRGTYAKAFRKHRKCSEKKMVEQWKEALRVAGSLKGENVKNWHEAELIKLVVTMVLSELKNTSLLTTEYLVGIQYHVKKLLKLLDVSSVEVRIVGIHGMGGIGKTTIAKAICNEISRHFEKCIFIEDVRESYKKHKGPIHMQKQLISNILKQKDVDITNADEGVNMIKERCCNKKVLVVLDDVDSVYQLRALTNKCDWFGLGSRIIITTRDKHILKQFEVDVTYEPNELDLYQSLKLFSMHSFKRDRPLYDYYDISLSIVHIAGGLPLALEVLGSSLYGKDKAVWQDTLKKLKKIPHDEVKKKLRISYDGLDNKQQQIFLDIACFFIGENKKIATYIWDDCEYFPQEGIDILLCRSMVKIGDNDELKMHNQLRDLGREIVYSENIEPGERSRLWFHDDAWEVLKTHTGTRKVQGLCLNFGNKSKKNTLRNEDFAEMSKLKLLQIDYAIIDGDYKNLLSKLRWLSWKGCPYNFTPTNFHPEKLIVLNLSWSKVTEDWKGWNQIKIAKKLKVIDLSGCYDLIKTPNFSAFLSLERLILEDCKNLVEIDTSIGLLKCLVFLNAQDCKSLVDLPISICGLNSLESLIVSGCTKLNRLPMGLGSLKALREIHIDKTSIEELSDSISLPEKLEILSVRNCQFLTVLPTLIGQLRFLTNLALDATQIVVLPESIGSLLKLQHLSLCDCRLLRKIPDSIGQLESLVVLNLDGTRVTEIPDSIGHLKSLTDFVLSSTKILVLPDSIGLLLKLQRLSLCDCRSLRKIPNSIGQLESLVDLDLGGAGVTEIPDSIGHLKSLTDFVLSSTKILVLPNSIGSLLKLQRLSLYDCRSLRKIPNSIGQLESLVNLNLDGAGVTEIPDSIGQLKSLTDFVLSSKKILMLPDSIGSLLKLQRLSLCYCRSLRKIPNSIGQLESLVDLNLDGAGVIEIPNSIGHLKSLIHVKLDFTKITELPDSIGLLVKLEKLSLRYCRLLRRIPDSIWRLESLLELDLSHMTRIIEVPEAIGELKSLTRLSLGGTKIIELPDSIGLLSMLQSLSLKKCESLRRIPDCIWRLESLSELYLTGTMIIEIPDAIGELKSLTRLYLGGTQIIELPDSIGLLSMLQCLSLEECGSLRRIPDGISRLESLHELYLTGTGIIEIPDAIGELKSLTNLNLGFTQVIELPDSIGLLSMLEVLSLKKCESLKRIPDYIGRLESLRELYLMRTGINEIPDEIGELKSLTYLRLDSTQIIELPDSIGLLSMLQRLSLEECGSLSIIPDSIWRWESLRELNLIWTGIIEIPDAIGELKSLTHLQLDNTQIIELPDSIGLLSMLQHLSLEECGSLSIVPDSIWRLDSLRELNLVGTRITKIPDTVGHLKSLVDLQLDGNQIAQLPDSIWSLSKLEFLAIIHYRSLRKMLDPIWKFESLLERESNATGKLRNLKDLRIDETGIDALDFCIAREEIPSDIRKLSSLRRLTLWSENSFSLPESISSLPLLEELHIRNCRNHPSLPDLPSSLSVLNISDCMMETFPNLSNLTDLYDLTIGDCENLLGFPSSSSLSNLTMLRIYNCKKLQCLPHLPSGLELLYLSSCMSIESLPDLSNLKEVYELHITDFVKQTEILGLEKMKYLTSLNLSGCRSLERLPNMSIMKRLQFLILRNCEKLCDIQGLERLKSLERLDISGCVSLERLPILPQHLTRI